MSRRAHFIAPALLAAACSAALGAASRPELIQRYRTCQATVRAALELLKAKEYPQAIAKLKEADALVPKQPTVHYNLACALSLGGRTEDALDALARAVRLGFVDHEHIKTDPDLAPLRKTDRYRELVGLAEKQAKPQPSLVHTPKGYDPKGEKAYPLFVALHGAGGTPQGMMRLAKRALGTDDYFLLAPFGSSRMGPGYTWNNRDLARIAREAGELKKKHRIDKIYLYGFSAGAHIGYVLVLKYPGRFDGFIPMAGALRRRWVTPEDLKNAKGLRVYAIQGKTDPVVPLRAAQQSLTLFKKQGAHTHLFTHPGAHRAPKDFATVLRDAIRWIDQGPPRHP